MNRVLSFFDENRPVWRYLALITKGLTYIVIGILGFLVTLLYLAGFMLIVLLLSVLVGLLPPPPPWLRDNEWLTGAAVLTFLAIWVIIDNWRSDRRFQRMKRKGGHYE